MRTGASDFLGRFGLALMAGLAHAASIATPWNGQPAWWLQLAALAALAALLQRSASSREAAVLGWGFAWAWLSGTFWWLFVSMHTYGGLPAALAVIAVLALAGVLALYYGVISALYKRCAALPAWTHPGVFAALWLAAELARGLWFTGFGWGGAGYAHVDGPLSAYAPWTGAYGVAALAAAVAMGLSQGWRLGRWAAGVLIVLLALPSGVAPLMTEVTRSRGELTVALLQGNIPQDEKFQPGSGVAQALRWYGEQLGRPQAPLLIAPETAIPLLPDQLPTGYWDELAQRYSASQQAALIGVPWGNLQQGYTNSVLGLAPGLSTPWRYDKHHLVPFGEFIPTGFKWFTELMNIPLGDFRRGALGQPGFEWQGQRLAAHVCYEDLFGEELAMQFRDPAKAPTVLVNVSNIAWFGNTVAIDQHLSISRMRALELARPVVRATNTGATVIIDHRGHVQAALPRHTRGVLLGQVEGREGLTPYACWVSRLGLWPLWLVSGGVVLLAAGGRRRRAGAGLDVR